MIADTHIPDRIKTFPAHFLTQLKAEKVDQILHAGDVSSWRVIEALEQIAPTSVVQGNRDWFFQFKAPRSIQMTLHGIKIVLTHGHETIPNYLYDKLITMIKGYRFERYQKHLSRIYPEADVILFGHTHRQIARTIAGQLFFNPGSVCPCQENNWTPEFGLLRITPEGNIHPEFRQLANND